MKYKKIRNAAGISLVKDKFHARSAFHKSACGFISTFFSVFPLLYL